MIEPAPAATPTLWIDATRPAAAWRLWGMSLVERLLREAARRGVRRAEIVVSPASREAARLRRDFHRLHTLDVVVREAADTAAAWDGLAAAGAAGEDGAAGVLVMDGDSVVDDRILDHLLEAGPGTLVGADGVAAAHLPSASLAALDGAAGLTTAALDGAVRRVSVDELGSYVPELRLTMPPFLLRLDDPAQLRRVDRLLFHRTFKGVIDAVARYGYYHFVRFTTRLLSRTEVSPNLLTALSILGIWAAVPLFALGHLGWGIASAWLGVILDSVDGKLARLTVNLSDAMGAIEHAAAMPGLGLWFVALGWHLSGGDLWTPTPTSIACGVLVLAFLADKALSGAFKAWFGFELFDARPVDAAFHLIAARRNTHLLALTVGALLGEADTAFRWMTAGMVFTFGFHALRFAWIALTGGRSPARG